MARPDDIVSPDRDTPDVPQMAFDPTDPHGFHAGETHGHVIVPMRVLLGVLVVLLILTILTVFASQAEIWISDAFAVQLPQSVNVSVAMSIAVVKGLLVVLYFMQLRYDKGLNAIIFAFCLLTVGIFMGFTTMDFFSRDEVYRAQAGEIIPGGTGGFVRQEIDATREPTGVTVPTGMPVTAWAATRERPESHDDDHHPEHELILSSPDHTVKMYGPMLFARGHAPQHGPVGDEEHPPVDAPDVEQAPEGDAGTDEPLTPAGGG